jgi:hypothetical protein
MFPAIPDRADSKVLLLLRRRRAASLVSIVPSDEDISAASRRSKALPALQEYHSFRNFLKIEAIGGPGRAAGGDNAEAIEQLERGTTPHKDFSVGLK